MCQYLNESDSTLEFLRSVIEMKDRRIEELEAEVEDLIEYKWMYQELCE